MQENTTPDFSKLFEVDPSSPTGLKWKDNINDGITGRGKNLFAGKPAGVKKEITGRSTTLNVLIKRKAYVVSRIIWELTYGPIPDGYVIDHLDGNPLNNKIENLACKTRAGNMRNRKKPKNNKSGVVGVRKEGNNWIAFYRDQNGKDVCGRFSISKHGEEAFNLAVQFRMEGIKKMNDEFNFDYTERHVGEAFKGVLSDSNI